MNCLINLARNTVLLYIKIDLDETKRKSLKSIVQVQIEKIKSTDENPSEKSEYEI